MHGQIGLMLSPGITVRGNKVVYPLSSQREPTVTKRPTGSAWQGRSLRGSLGWVSGRKGGTEGSLLKLRVAREWDYYKQGGTSTWLGVLPAAPARASKISILSGSKDTSRKSSLGKS